MTKSDQPYLGKRLLEVSMNIQYTEVHAIAGAIANGAHFTVVYTNEASHAELGLGLGFKVKGTCLRLSTGGW